MIRFEEHEGDLFRILEEPVPLTPDAEMPCLIRLIQDDSPMGRYNKSYSEYRYGVRLGCCMLPIIATHIAKNGVVNDIEWDVSRYEIIGYPVQPNSADWALYRLMQGDIVMGQYREDDAIVTPISKGWHEVIRVGSYGKRRGAPITDNDFLFLAEKIGWQIYEEPKPESQYKVGAWVECNGNQRLIEIIGIDLERGNYYHFAHGFGGAYANSITRKLKPSEVIVRIGCLSGTIAKSSDPNHFLMLHSRPITDCNYSIIRFSAIDTTTRYLVESLLKAQEEDK